MKLVAVKVARPVKVIVNSQKRGDQWGQIRCVASGKILHTGRLSYIKRIAEKRYNSKVNI